MPIQHLSIADITIDPRLQMRAELQLLQKIIFSFGGLAPEIFLSQISSSIILIFEVPSKGH